jgi:phosphohistidine swiveling domain-containing protein
MTPQVVYESPDGTPFPVEWAHADLARDQWRWDQVHNPTPLTPLAQDLIALKREGMYRGGDATGRPFHEERIYANGYGFSRRQEGDPRSTERSRALAARDSEERIDRLIGLWESSYLPETEALTRLIQEWASPDDSLLDLLRRYDQIEIAWRRCGELHTLSTGLAGVAMRQFDEFCRDKFGDEGTRVAVESISGMPNMSVKSGVALWELSREAASRPAAADLLRSHPAEEFLSTLDDVAEGPAFKRHLDQFLETWGQRNESYYEVGYLTWREDSEFVLSIIRTYIDAPEDRNPTVLHQRAVETRIARTEDVASRLDDPAVLDEFLIGQRRAQQHTVLMEDHNYFIDQRAYTSLRTPHQAIGARLVEAGALDNADDVFYLHIAEIKEHGDHPDRKYQALIAGRQADRERWMHVLPPQVIGGDAPLATSNHDVGSEPVRIASIQGLAASAGTVTGTARVILSLDEASQLSPGDILVTYATAPPWTPLFAIAGGVVTDAGGPLAHCAVVAREYGIPAVVGTTKATSAIKDGMTISIDGTTGLVTIQG